MTQADEASQSKRWRRMNLHSRSFTPWLHRQIPIKIRNNRHSSCFSRLQVSSRSSCVFRRTAQLSVICDASYDAIRRRLRAVRFINTVTLRTTCVLFRSQHCVSAAYQMQILYRRPSFAQHADTNTRATFWGGPEQQQTTIDQDGSKKSQPDETARNFEAPAPSDQPSRSSLTPEPNHHQLMKSEDRS